jgi:thiamine-monophosphate kinase
MGARPAWALLALTLPSVQEDWLAEFAQSLAALAIKHEVELVGGDTTRGPLSVTVQVLGHVPRTGALRRTGGRSGDALFVSGTPGDAAAGLGLEQGGLGVADPDDARYLRERFRFPTPRVELGLRLRTLASACIDVSDGLLGDASKLARASGCGAQLQLEDVPVSPALERLAGYSRARELALSGGDDYELCFTIPPARLERLQTELPPQQWRYRRIGTLCEGSDVQVRAQGALIQVSTAGYEHFS